MLFPATTPASAIMTLHTEYGFNKQCMYYDDDTNTDTNTNTVCVHNICMYACMHVYIPQAREPKDLEGTRNRILVCTIFCTR